MTAPTPPITANLAARYRASELAVADGARVTSWADLSGNSRTITSGTGPIYRATGLNGFPSCEFAAAAGEKLAAGSAWVPKPSTIYGVVQVDSVAATYWWGSHTGFTAEVLLGMGTTSRWTGSFDGTQRGGTAGDVTNTVHAVAADGTNVINYWRNELGYVRQGFYAAAGFLGAGPGTLRIGGKSAAGNEWDGKISEVLVYSAMHTVSEMVLMEGWLAKEYHIGPWDPVEYGGLPVSSSSPSLPTSGRIWPR